jgi:uracil-DNA glycosylase
MSAGLRHGVCDLLEYFRVMGIEYIPVERSAIKAAAGVKKVVVRQSVPAPHREQEAPGAMGPAQPGPEACADMSSVIGRVAPEKEAALAELHKEIGDCSLCGLCNNRKNVVFGEGDPESEIMFVGEAPGREEDMQARPFVGEAGVQLTRLIEKLGLHREGVYIANICKCRPPENRDPEEAEIASCFPFLNKQIRTIAPRVIVALGKISTYSLMKPHCPITKFSILKTRGKWFQYCGVPVMPTTHPAYWLRNREDKHRVMEDMQAVLKMLGEGAA